MSTDIYAVRNEWGQDFWQLEEKSHVTSQSLAITLYSLEGRRNVGLRETQNPETKMCAFIDFERRAATENEVHKWAVLR